MRLTRKLFGPFVAAALVLAGPAGAQTMDTEAYDLLFRNGTLDEIDRDATITYRREVENALKPEAAVRDTGEIELSFEPGTDPEEAHLRFVQGEMHRGLGAFPASVGNPMIMYFVETVVRDMAESTGGSPFYIRNRVKEALIQPAEVTEGGEQTTVVLRPFEDDPNAERMQGFGELRLEVVMSDEVPGWYRSLSAVAPGTGAAPAYASGITYAGIAETGQ